MLFARISWFGDFVIRGNRVAIRFCVRQPTLLAGVGAMLGQETEKSAEAPQRRDHPPAKRHEGPPGSESARGCVSSGSRRQRE
jgi:hypothetical protein